MERHVANREQPAHVPTAPMGDVPVIVRVVWSDGAEEWRPARAVRWTHTHVMVGWRTDATPAGRRASVGATRQLGGAAAGAGGTTARAGAGASGSEQWVWLRAGDVMRSVTWLVAPDRGGGRPAARPAVSAGPSDPL